MEENIIKETVNGKDNLETKIIKPDLQMLKIESGITVIIENLQNAAE